MPPKRAGEPLFYEETMQKPKLNSGIEKASASEIQELELAFGEYDNRSNVLHLTREIAKKPDLPANFAMRLLGYCVRAGSEDVASQLLTHQTIDLNTLEGGCLLWETVEKGQAEMAILLVNYGADLSVRCTTSDGDGEITLLHKILRNNRIDAKEAELLRLMLESGADVNARDSKGNSLLHYAIINSDNRSYQLAEELLRHGAHVTINKQNHRMDDIFLACRHKLQLLPKLIQHHVPDEETRNQRAIVAIHCLISENIIGGAEQVVAMKMVKEILDLGVPVNVPDNQREKRKFSFLNTALWFKNQAAVKLLLEYGANPHQTNLRGHTTLYQATAFKGYTHACRWFIERGVSIHVRNTDGRCPIHGACKNKSVRNIHLLLNLGADLNATDNEGRTPFALLTMKESLKDNEAHYLIIKHFALMEARGGKISDEDMARVNQCVWSKNHFDKCTEELGRMKLEKVYGYVSYFSILSENIYGMVLLMKNRNFFENFKKDQKKQAILFSEYFYMLVHSFEIAGKRLEMLVEEKKQLHEVFLNVMPDYIVENIAYHLCFEKLERCQNDYYMTFHETLKNTQANKVKIL